MSLYDRRFSPQQQVYTSNQEEEEDNEDDNEDDEDYDDEEEDEDDNYELNPALMNMSADLRRMLGLAVDEKDVLQTDWRPPERPGLDNSAPLVNTSTANNANVVRPVGTFNAAPALSALSAVSALSPAVPPLAMSQVTRGSAAAPSVMVYPTYRETERDREGLDNEDDDDDEEDDDEEEEEDDNRESALSRLTNLSADLRRALGLPVDSTIAPTQTDWRPPSKPGLDNSAPIIAPRAGSASNNNGNNNNNNNNYISNNSKPLVPTNNNISKNAPVNNLNSNNINTNMINTNNANSSGVEEEEEDEEDYDDDDEEDIDFIPRTRSNGIAEIAMSAELRRALGLPPLTTVPSLFPEKTDWRPPTTFGLANSEPIVRTAANARPVPIMSTTLNNNNYNPISNTNTNNIFSSRSGEESFQDDDDDEEEEEEEEEEEREMDFSSLQMSDNLKRSLGLLPASAPAMVTDWRPPEHSGLDNSDPIVPTRENVMRPLYNVRVPTSADAVAPVKKELIPRRITSSLPSDMRKLSNELQLSSELKRALGLE